MCTIVFESLNMCTLFRFSEYMLIISESLNMYIAMQYMHIISESLNLYWHTTVHILLHHHKITAVCFSTHSYAYAKLESDRKEANNFNFFVNRS